MQDDLSNDHRSSQSEKESSSKDGDDGDLTTYKPLSLPGEGHSDNNRAAFDLSDLIGHSRLFGGWRVRG